MNILLSTDNNYVMPTGVLMHSIGIHNKNVEYFVLVDEKFSPESKHDLIDVASQYNSHISFYVVDDSITKDLPFGTKKMPSHVTLATYYRLFLTKLLPSSIHKIIYLDGDMIVRHDISHLWNTDIKDYAIGVVHDMDEKRHANLNRLPYPMQTGYFNAGMMLINLDYWRSHDCLASFITFISEHTDVIIYHDQDVLNSVLYDKKKWVPLTYNFQSGFLYNEKTTKDYPKSLDIEVASTMKDAAVIHFSTPTKPWMLDSFHPYTAAWRHYKALSKWKNVRLIGDNAQTFRKHVRNFLVRHNLWNLAVEYIKFTIRR